MPTLLSIRKTIIKKTYFTLRKFFPVKTEWNETSHSPRVIAWGNEQKTHTLPISPPPPKIIWSYWEGSASPTVRACIDSWRKYAGDYSIKLLSSSDVKSFIPDFPHLPKSLPPQKISNLVRLMLLEHHGGIWMDASILLTAPITWLLDNLTKHNSEALAFWNEFHEEYSIDHSRPIIENGLLVAYSGSRFISKWRENYQQCISSENYKEYYMKMKNHSDLIKNFKNKEKSNLEYFVCYIAAQQTMLESHKYKLSLINAEDEYYSLYYGVSPPRNTRKFVEKLLLCGYHTTAPARIIKLHGGHRQMADEYIKYGCIRYDSLLGQYLR